LEVFFSTIVELLSLCAEKPNVAKKPLAKKQHQRKAAFLQGKKVFLVGTNLQVSAALITGLNLKSKEPGTRGVKIKGFRKSVFARKNSAFAAISSFRKLQ
jgi:hypothetical protein